MYYETQERKALFNPKRQRRFQPEAAAPFSARRIVVHFFRFVL